MVSQHFFTPNAFLKLILFCLLHSFLVRRHAATEMNTLPLIQIYFYIKVRYKNLWKFHNFRCLLNDIKVSENELNILKVCIYRQIYGEIFGVIDGSGAVYNYNPFFVCLSMFFHSSNVFLLWMFGDPAMKR